MFNSDAIQGGDVFGGAKQVNARTQEIPTSASTVAAHDPNKETGYATAMTKSPVYKDADNGTGNAASSMKMGSGGKC